MRLTVLAGLGDVARHFLTLRVSKGDACPGVILFWLALPSAMRCRQISFRASGID